MGFAGYLLLLIRVMLLGPLSDLGTLNLLLKDVDDHHHLRQTSPLFVVVPSERHMTYCPQRRQDPLHRASRGGFIDTKEAPKRLSGGTLTQSGQRRQQRVSVVQSERVTSPKHTMAVWTSQPPSETTDNGSRYVFKSL